ncbi:MAG: Hsp20/alpha crystallin family protein [Acidobacteria bacterium]|nr:Hsp20/alpha crystallin family protein [Acidobacteriota bacterium]
MSSLMRWEPFRDIATLRDRMERVFNELPGRGDEGLTAGAWVPPVDVYETNDAIVLKADLPNMKENDVDISVEGNTLTIKGERKRDKEVEERNYYRVERYYGAFTRTFTLPPTVDHAKIEATFSRGVLKISLPKREESKPRQIKVKVQSNGN